VVPVDTGVIDQDVDVPPMPLNRFVELVDLLETGDIRGEGSHRFGKQPRGLTPGLDRVTDRKFDSAPSSPDGQRG